MADHCAVCGSKLTPLGVRGADELQEVGDGVEPWFWDEAVEGALSRSIPDHERANRNSACCGLSYVARVAAAPPGSRPGGELQAARYRCASAKRRRSRRTRRRARSMDQSGDPAFAGASAVARRISPAPRKTPPKISHFAVSHVGQLSAEIGDARATSHTHSRFALVFLTYVF